MSELPGITKRVLTSRSAEETAALGAEIAGSLRPGDVVVLSGELGAGKSTLIRGAAGALGVTGAIPSPSFMLGRRYAATESGVSHLDLYRLTSLESEDPALLEDYLTADAVSFVEWPEVGAEAIRRVVAAHEGRVIKVMITRVSERERVVEIAGEPPMELE